MKKNTLEYVHQLMATENQYVQKLNDIVKESLMEESLLTHQLKEEDNDTQSTFGERLADKNQRLPRR